MNSHVGERVQETPVVVIASFSKISTTDLAKDILVGDGKTSETCPDCGECLQTFLWHVDTRYYTADVELCAITANEIPVTNAMKEKLDVMAALIVLFDSCQRHTFDEARNLMKLLGDYDPEIKLLVCENFSGEESEVTKIESQEWGLKHGFEVIELQSEENSDSEDDFPETIGIKRIIQALHAHQWPNLILKDKPTCSAPAFTNVYKPSGVNQEMMGMAMKSLSLEANNESTDRQSSHFAPETDVLNLLEEHDLDLEDGSFDAFEKVFQKFQTMKENVQRLPPSERKEYAERVAIAFWRAVGGNEEEIEGLED